MKRKAAGIVLNGAAAVSDEMVKETWSGLPQTVVRDEKMWYLNNNKGEKKWN